MENKRGQGMSVNTIILLVLGIFVLVVLILGFTMGWGKLSSFLSNKNVDTIQQACNMACSTKSVYSFCSEKRELIGDEKFKDVTCYFLANDELNGMSKYGIDKCEDVTCEVVLPDVPVNNEEFAKTLCSGKEAGTIIQYLPPKTDTLIHHECKPDEGVIAPIK